MRPPALRRAAVALVLALAALAAPRAAWSAAVEEPTTGLRVAVAPAGAAVCRLLPHEPPDAPGCAGLDVLGLEQKLLASKDQVAAVVAIRFDDWGVVLTVKGELGVKLRNAEQIDGFLHGVREGIARAALGSAEPLHGDTPGAHRDLLKLNGVDVVRATTTFAAPPGSPAHGANHLRIYLAASRTGLATLSFAGPPERAADLAALADGIVGTLSMADSGVEDFGKPRDYFMGKLIGKLVGAMLPLVALLAAGVVVMVSRRRKKATGG